MIVIGIPAPPRSGIERSGFAMVGIAHVACRCVALVVFAGGLVSGAPSTLHAQQLGGSPLAGSRPISTEVAFEYATIGAVQLSIPVLSASGIAPGPSGQFASNLQNGIGNASQINQTGQGNRAALQVVGNDNIASILQQGRDNVGRGVIAGDGRALDLRQIGNGNQADLQMTGARGGSLAVSLFGDGNVAAGLVPGGRDVTVSQSGGASVDVAQFGAQKSIGITQTRAR